MRRAIVLVFLAVSTAMPAHADGPELSFHREGGHSPYRDVSVRVDAKGNVKAVLTRQSGKQKLYATVLNPLEVAALEFAISSSNIIAADFPNSDRRIPGAETGTTTISVKTSSGQRELAYAHIRSLQPLEDFLWRIVTQADLSDAPKDNDGMYELLSAIDPTSVASKVLQPYVFRDPLAASIAAQTDFQQVTWRLQALSCIMSTTEFSGLVSRQLDRSDLKRWRFWLTTLSTPECYGNLQAEHLRSLLPVFADQMRRFGDTAKTVSTPEGEAFYRFRKIMQQHNYLPE